MLDRYFALRRADFFLNYRKLRTLWPFFKACWEKKKTFLIFCFSIVYLVFLAYFVRFLPSPPEGIP
ncbi:hypothetical protein SGRA_0465 [Saprospira grandis str. Lewin]|uniref:Uncharacterized protein n=1 Tax=Saprospira grandis (strain Lewin) TaxID=984262 RepID=H6L9M6_SAPGL|nr:hypothetical protein SGRA_0465 [Saprospira grandis str. Lewin]